MRAQRKAAKPAQPEPLTRQKLELIALAYVNRFEVSAQKLRAYLKTRARKLGGGAEAEQWIAELTERYLGSGVLDDARLARNLTAQLGARGKSTRAIAQKLMQRGVPGDVADALFQQRKLEEPAAELTSARAYVRKRRLGAHRPPELREQYRHKDLAALARQGFSFEIARQALGAGPSTDDEF